MTAFKRREPRWNVTPIEFVKFIFLNINFVYIFNVEIRANNKENLSIFFEKIKKILKNLKYIIYVYDIITYQRGARRSKYNNGDIN